MAGPVDFEKSLRPEQDLAQREPAPSPAPTAAAPAIDRETSLRQAQLWAQIGAGPPESSEDAAALAIDHKGAGDPVDASLAAQVGSHTGEDVSGARIHKDPLSRRATRAMNARAFAHGQDIFLGPGESEADPELMGHELTHVAQQQAATAQQKPPQRKVAIGAANSPAEQHADQVGAKVAAGAAPSNLLVDGGPLVPGQMYKRDFVLGLRAAVVRVVEQELGKLGATAGCPYIDKYFSKYAHEPAHVGESLLRHWLPNAKFAHTAQDLVPLVTVRVREAVRAWNTTGRLPPDLSAIDPSIASDIATASAAKPQTHMKSLDAMEAELGPGQPLDGATAARMSRVVGTDVSTAARIHTGPTAQAMAAQHGAAAFAVGPNVVMGSAAPTSGIAADALLAHELAHTAQQAQAATDPAARKKPIGEKDAAAERDAGTARLGNFAGAIGDVMRTGLQLQRCPAPDKVPDQDNDIDVPQRVVETSNRVPEAAAFSEALPVLAGKRTYTITGHRRDAGVFVQIEQLGTREAFEVPIAGAVAAGAQFRVEGRRLEAGKSQLDVVIAAGKVERRLWVAIEPSQYEGDADRPDRVRVFNGGSVLEKDVYPAGSQYKLSPTGADASTVVALPGSGKAKGGEANIVVEVAPRPSNPGVAITLNLQKSGEKKAIALEAPDLTSHSARLTRHAAGKPDARGNPTHQVVFDILDASGTRTSEIDIALTSWADAGAKDEGYTWEVSGARTKQTGGFTVPPSSTDARDFNTRILNNSKGIVETVAGDRGYQVQLATAGGKGLNLMFHRPSPQATEILFVMSSQATGDSERFTIPYAGETFRPRIVDENAAGRGQLYVGFDGSSRDLMVSWDVQDIDGDAPKLDESNGPGHIVLARAKASVVQLLVAGNGLPPWQATWRTPLPPEFIMPPRWVHTWVGPRVGWLQRDGHRFVPDDQLGPQVQGAEIAKIFGQQLAIGYVHSIPVVGELVMVGEAIVGKEIVTGRTLTTEERVFYLALGAIAAVLGAAAAVSAARTQSQAIAREAAALAKVTGMSEIEAEALIRASMKLSKEEQAFLTQARASTQAGKQLTKDEAARAKVIFDHLEADRASIKASLGKAKGATPVGAGAPLGKDSVIIDANTAIALNKRQLGLPLQPGEQALLKKLDSMGASEYRITNVAASARARSTRRSWKCSIATTSARARASPIARLLPMRSSVRASPESRQSSRPWAPRSTTTCSASRACGPRSWASRYSKPFRTAST